MTTTSRLLSPIRLSVVFVAILILIGSAVAETVLYQFKGEPADGSDSVASLVHWNGKFYGTTVQGGGQFGHGSVFEVTPPATPGGSWTETVLYSFTGDSDGGNPSASVIFDIEIDGATEATSAKPAQRFLCTMSKNYHHKNLIAGYKGTRGKCYTLGSGA